MHQNSVIAHDSHYDGMRLVEHVYMNGISHFHFGTMHAANMFSFKPKKPNVRVVKPVTNAPPSKMGALASKLPSKLGPKVRKTLGWPRSWANFIPL
jgi:hypothetical protein